ncbi:RES family NAD+ phosphorylase [Agromyces larvae]|uniref:RES family NAD+ phosphorylase n=1 Tax=Agromyces larvae TaxID=2929802 RepID=A0ABY4C1S5_9MICO|nr:RES family NAD+ phosphorylase [Agromyces larvae]UOE44969.1 RES family NAD+ phosphorylase [Agromyces larvae]
MTREQVAQQLPASDLDLTDFPSAWLNPTATLARAHSADRNAGWFSSNLGGRFDLPAPDGTCYLADGVLVALREALGVVTLNRSVPATDVDARAVTLLTNVAGRFAGVSLPEAASFSVTSELTSMTPYAVPQAWARAFRAADFDGIRYGSRFTPGAATSWALFGEAGAHPIGTTVEVITGREACKRAGLNVLEGPPRSSDLTKVEPPV